MIQTSPTYDPYSTIRRVGIRIDFGVIDSEASDIKSTEDSGDLFSRVSEITDKKTEITPKFATLENNLWVLDGTYDLMPKDKAGISLGWWSSGVSDSQGNFASAQYIKYTFTDAISTVGWTLRFDPAGAVPSMIIVSLFDSTDAVREEIIFEGGGDIQIISAARSQYYGVRFDFVSTDVPERRIRLTEIEFGISESRSAEEIGEAEFKYGFDIATESFPTAQLTFTFDNSDKKYNMLDPDEIYEYLESGQAIKASLIINGESVDMGNFYFESATTNNSAITPKITAFDIVYSLDGLTFGGGADKICTLAEAVAEVIGKDDISVIFHGDVKARLVSMAIPGGKSRRESLRLLAQAAMCNIWCDRENALHFGEIVIGDEFDVLSPDVLNDYRGVSVAEPFDYVSLKVENSFMGNGDTSYLEKSDVTESNFWGVGRIASYEGLEGDINPVETSNIYKIRNDYEKITFTGYVDTTQPSYFVAFYNEITPSLNSFVKGIEAANSDLVDGNLYSITINKDQIPAGVQSILFGSEKIGNQTKLMVYKKIPIEKIANVTYTAGEGKRGKTISNPCVAPENGEAVAAWLLERINWRKKYAVKNRCNPAIESTDTIRIFDTFGNTGLAVVTGQTIRYNGALNATFNAVGKK